MANNRLRAVGFLAVGAAVVLGACSSLVGADFDGLSPAVDTAAGTSPGGAGGAGGSVNQGGAQSQAGNAASGTGGVPPSGGGDGGEGGAPHPSGGEGGVPPGGGAGAGGDGGGNGGGEGGMPQGGFPSGGAGGEGPASPSSVVLNELKGQGSGADYIELYNPGPFAADLGGAYVGDDSANRVTFPEGTTIPANGYVLVRLQQAVTTGMVTSCFGYELCFDGTVWGISAGGEAIFFHDAHGVLIDTLTYPNEMGPNGVENGQAYGRLTDGAETLGAITQSPGFANAAVN